ncbi:outer membrane beta-barrel protein [Pontibacter litorisediminis]|uniref:outer membrane beta-barrel protein n=1 Tax=Pontibacter litorisediminis TaxID=1846260 RepID=UPI0023ED31C2|nr:outer membrane beta-barrel protein [Pontibacter litorisediminis]
MKTKLIFCFICTFIYIHTATAQKLSFGPSFGLINQGDAGRVLLDSVQAELQGGGDLGGYFGGYVSYRINRAFSISSGINYYDDGLSYIVYNTRTDCQFCPLVKAGGVAHASLEVPLLVEFNIPLTEGKLFVMAGVSPSVRLQRKGGAYYFHKDAGRGVSDVLPAMRTAVKPVVWDSSVGVGANVWRLRLEARYQANLTRSATNAVKVWGKDYDFMSSHANMRLGLGYNLNWKRK